MPFRALTVFAVCVTSILLLAGSSSARLAMQLPGERGPNTPMASQTVCHGSAMHDVGKLVLSVNNNGTFGTAYAIGTSADYFSGAPIPAGGGEYPKGSATQYLYGASFWVGAVVGRDTLVTLGSDGWLLLREMFPDVAPFGCMKKRSIIDPDAPEAELAVSEQDYIAVYTDTFINLATSDAEDGGRQHIPLNIEVTQNSYAWSYSYAEDLILFDYQIRNVGSQRLRNVFMGIYVDADVCFNCDGGNGAQDDICGFRLSQQRLYKNACLFEDTVYIAWIADNDGDFQGGVDARPVPHVTATRIVRTPADTLDVSFNWWISNGDAALDFGPREKPLKGEWKEPFRDFGTGGTGTPSRDRNKYYSLRNQEFDYDQAYTFSISPNDSMWLYVPDRTQARDFADGYDTRYLLSFGPFDISPGQKLPLSFAYVAGENFHDEDNPTNAQLNLPNNPDQFYEGLNFADLGTNATWASWIYDNPGVDTDSNGFAGKADTITYYVNGDVDCGVNGVPAGGGTNPPPSEIREQKVVFRTGDGIPDFKGASPPPAPEFWVEPSAGRLRVLFNGLRSETTPDQFADGIRDFEGYRVYVGRDNRASSYSLVASFDREDYNEYEYDPLGDEWLLLDIPKTLAELKALYGEDFEPLAWTRSRPFSPAGPTRSLYYAKQDYNVSDLTDPTGIHKVYPDEPYPSSENPDEAAPSELTPEGRLKYFEYEFFVDSLLPTVPYFVNVTAFDFGSPASGLPSLETSVSVNSQSAYPLATAQAAVAQDLDVLVYPNPYRIDGDYRELGFEGRGNQDRPANRVREIHFANLPAKCTIRIYTMDGDLVREIIHNVPTSDPKASHDSWDMITRNTQMVVSGLYYWTVEDEEGEVQMGKLAIIM